MQIGSSDLHNVYSCTRKMRTIVKCGVGSTVRCHCPSMLCVYTCRTGSRSVPRQQMVCCMLESRKSHTEV